MFSLKMFFPSFFLFFLFLGAELLYKRLCLSVFLPPSIFIAKLPSLSGNFQAQIRYFWDFAGLNTPYKKLQGKIFFTTVEDDIDG